MRASMAAPNGALALVPGPMADAAARRRIHSGSTRKRWRSALSRVHWRMPPVRKSRLTGAMSATHRCARDVVADLVPDLPDLPGRIPADEQIGSGEPANADCPSSPGSARSGLKHATGLFSGRPSPCKCHDAIADRGAQAFGHALEPVAFVSSLPPRKNARLWKTVTAGALALVPGPLADNVMADNVSPRNEALRASKYLGRALWRRW